MNDNKVCMGQLVHTSLSSLQGGVLFRPLDLLLVFFTNHRGHDRQHNLQTQTRNRLDSKCMSNRKKINIIKWFWINRIKHLKLLGCVVGNKLIQMQKEGKKVLNICKQDYWPFNIIDNNIIFKLSSNVYNTVVVV